MEIRLCAKLDINVQSTFVFAMQYYVGSWTLKELKWLMNKTVNLSYIRDVSIRYYVKVLRKQRLYTNYKDCAVSRQLHKIYSVQLLVDARDSIKCG